jgi:hypothetical protein
MLLNETDLKTILPVSKSFSFENMRADVKRAQLKFIRPILGKDLESILEAAYADEELTEQQQELMDRVQPALAHLSFMLFAPKGNVFVTDNGFMDSHTDTLKPAFQWKVKDFQRSMLMNGYDGLDELIEYLEEVANTDFADWLDSEACTLAREHFINTASEFTKYVNKLNYSRYQYMQLRPTLRRVEDNLIKSILGNDLYAAIKTQIQADNVNAQNAMLMPDIKGAVAHLTWAESLEELAVIIDEEGIHLANTLIAQTIETKQPAEMQRIANMVAKHRAISKEYQQKITDTLYAAPDDFPLWRDSGLYVDPRISAVFENKEDSGIFGML